MNSKWDEVDLLCLRYCLDLSERDHEGAKVVLGEIDEKLSSLPTEEMSFNLKMRFKLHAILKEVLNSTAKPDVGIEELEMLEDETFKQLRDIFDAFHGNDRHPLVREIKKSEWNFGKYLELRKFQAQNISPPDKTLDILKLTDEQYKEYLKLIIDVIHYFESANRNSYYPVKDLSRAELHSLHELGPAFFHDLHRDFIRVFCFGLEVFHYMCGKTKWFKFSSGAENDDHAEPLIMRSEENSSFKQGASLFMELPESVQNEDESNQEVIESPTKLKSRRTQTILSSPHLKVSDQVTFWTSPCADTSVASTSWKGRGRRQKWTEEETQYLIDGVQHYGVGQWKSIRRDEKYKLGHKTNIQLKDKWRIITKHNLSLQKKK